MSVGVGGFVRPGHVNLGRGSVVVQAGVVGYSSLRHSGDEGYSYGRYVPTVHVLVDDDDMNRFGGATRKATHRMVTEAVVYHGPTADASTGQEPPRSGPRGRKAGYIGDTLAPWRAPLSFEAVLDELVDDDDVIGPSSPPSVPPV